MRVTVIGNFAKDFDVIMEEARELHRGGFTVLSPADPRVGMPQYCLPITASDIVWLVAPDGRVPSAEAVEIGMAVAAEIPVCSTSRIADETLRMYVLRVADVAEAVQRRCEYIEEMRRQCAEARQLLVREHAE